MDQMLFKLGSDNFFVLHLFEGDPGGFISECLTLGHINVVLGIFLVNISNSLEFFFNCLSFNNLPDKVMLEFVSHDHIHVIRRKCCNTELNLVNIFSNILWERSRISLMLSYFLCLILIESSVDITCGLTKSLMFNLLSFDVLHASQVC